MTVDVALNTVLVLSIREKSISFNFPNFKKILKTYVELVTAGVKMLEMMLEKREEKADNRLNPKNGSATRTLTGKLTGPGLSNEDWMAYGEA